MKDTVVRIRMTKAFKADIYKKAQSRGMSISEFVRYVVRKEMEK